MAEQVEFSEEQKTKRAVAFKLFLFAIPLGFIIYTLVRPYFTFGFFPIGWDSLGYIADARMLREGSWTTWFLGKGYHSFLYSVVMYLFTLMGIDPFTTDIFLPIFLALCVALLLSRLMSLSTGRGGFCLTTLAFASVWLSLYRLAADLYKTLLSTVLMLILFITILRQSANEDLNKKYFVTSFFTLLCMALVQLEMAIFTSFIVIIYTLAILLLRKTNLKQFVTNIFLVIIAVFPAFLYTLLSTTYFLALSVPMRAMPSLPSLGFVVLYCFGLSVAPFVIVGLMYLLRSSFQQRTPYQLLFFSWVIAEAAIVLPSYSFPIFLRKFAPRILLLFPMPILATLGFRKVRSTLVRTSEKSAKNRWASRALVVALIASVVSTAMFVPYETRIHLRPFVGRSTLEKVVWVGDNLQFSNKPLFVLNVEQLGLGASHAFLYDNLIGAVLGPHFRYLGNLYFLFLLEPTRSADFYLDRYGKIWLDDLQQAGFVTFGDLTAHDIIIIDDFYNPANSEKEMLEEVHPGIYLSAVSKLEDVKTVSINVRTYYSIWPPSGSWWFDEEDRLKLYIRYPQAEANVTFILPALLPGNYSIQIKYMDSTELHSPIVVAVKPRTQVYTTIGEIRYSGSMNFTTFTSTHYLNQGINLLTLRLTETDKPFYVFISAITITRTE